MCGGNASGTRSDVIVFYCVILSACGTRSGLLCYIFGVLRDRAWNALWRHSGGIVLYFLRVEVPCVECALTLLCYILRVWRSRTWNSLWNYCVILSACGGSARGTRSGDVFL